MSSVLHGPECDFLGMKLKFDGLKVRVDTRECIKKSVDVLGEPNLTPVMPPARNGLQHIDLDSPKGNESKKTFS